MTNIIPLICRNENFRYFFLGKLEKVAFISGQSKALRHAVFRNG